MRLIALEEAFAVPELSSRHPGFSGLGGVAVSEDFRRHVSDRLPDFFDLRLADMDEHGVDVQVLSLTVPGLQTPCLCPSDAASAARYANDRLAEVVAGRPERFVGLAAVPLQSPEEAVRELRRAVTELGLRGALVNDHTDGHYLDEARFDDFWTALEELGVPLYLHPGAPPTEAWHVFERVPELRGPSFQWAAETGAHALRIVYGGVFDRHPGARLILGHMGEYLPFMRSRLDSRYATLEQRPLRRAPSEYIGSNILITISGVPSPAALVGAVVEVGAAAIMLAIDYPYEDTGVATRAFRGAALSDVDRRKIAHGTAERVLGIAAEPSA